MPNIHIGNTIIPFPNSGSDANWAPPVIEFAELVAQILQGLASPFDVVPQVMELTSDANVNLSITSAIFPNGSVASFNFMYNIYRVNNTFSVIETGEVHGTYDAFNAVWILQREFNGEKQADGTSYHSFSMSGDQLQLTTIAIGGTYDSVNSRISYSAKSQLVVNP